MKWPVLILVIYCAVSAAFSNCTVQKRLYRQGFYVHKAAQKKAVQNPRDLPKKSVDHIAQKNCNVVSDQSSGFADDMIIAGAGSHSVMLNVIRNVTLPDQVKETRLPGDMKIVRAANPVQGKKKVHFWGLFAFVLSIGAWFVMEVFALPLFIIAAVLALYSINRISRDPEKYILKTLSLIALILSLVGVALSLFLLVLLLFS